MTDLQRCWSISIHPFIIVVGYRDEKPSITIEVRNREYYSSSFKVALEIIEHLKNTLNQLGKALQQIKKEYERIREGENK